MDEHGEIVRLRERISELEHEKAAVEGFAAVAAHELLAPVVLMDACAASVRDRLDERDAESLEELDTLRRGAARSRLLTETLLCHAASKDRPPQRRPLYLDAVVRDCIALLAPEIRRRKAQMVVTRPLPLVHADESLIAAVFMNLLVNALKYGPRQGATVRVGAGRLPGGWRFCVESEGEAIPVGDREHIFELHRRGRGERRTRGSGLGLFISRQIVERHGGEIAVGAAAGGGNRFSFTLPD